MTSTLFWKLNRNQIQFIWYVLLFAGFALTDCETDYISSSSSLSIPCIALRSASFSWSSAKLTKRDLLSKGLGFTCINPLLAQREILLAGMPNFPAATFIVTHCSAIKTLISHRTWILYHRKQYK